MLFGTAQVNSSRDRLSVVSGFELIVAAVGWDIAFCCSAVQRCFNTGMRMFLSETGLAFVPVTCSRVFLGLCPLGT